MAFSLLIDWFLFKESNTASLCLLPIGAISCANSSDRYIWSFFPLCVLLDNAICVIFLLPIKLIPSANSLLYEIFFNLKTYNSDSPQPDLSIFVLVGYPKAKSRVLTSSWNVLEEVVTEGTPAVIVPSASKSPLKKAQYTFRSLVCRILSGMYGV